jgi:hypothetical protein
MEKAQVQSVGIFEILFSLQIQIKRLVKKQRSRIVNKKHKYKSQDRVWL